MQIREALTFDDVLLIPAAREIIPAQADTRTRVTKDIEIVKVALLLTGCIQGIRNTVADYLSSFSQVIRYCVMLCLLCIYCCSRHAASHDNSLV